MRTLNGVQINSISMSGVIDSANVSLRVEYTNSKGETVVEYGQYSVASNCYWPALDSLDDDYDTLQELVEKRG